MTSSLPDGSDILDGIVYDANTALGIPSAYVFVELDQYYYETWTDEQGEYLFTDLPACAYDAGFNAIGYYNQSDLPFSITDGLVTTLDTHLTAAMPELSTDLINIHVPENSLGEYRLLISNAGTGDLHFHISDIPTESGFPTAVERPGLPTGIDEELYATLNSSPGATSKFIVYFKEQADLAPAFSITDRYARGQYVLDALRAVASRSQAGLAAELDRLGIEYEPRYIVNAMQVTGDLHLVNQIAALPEVGFIGANLRVSAPKPVEMSPTGGGISALAWNIAQVRADEVWDEFGVTGTGIVVSNIDTGVQYDHPALVNQYRGNQGAGVFDHNYNWWDPYGDQPIAPYDYHAHGSHTIGTMVGDDGTEHIGMAPDGQWIACNGFKQGGYGYSAELLECAEFILAPWDLTGANPNPDLRPDIVNNSWGGGQADWWYNQAIYAWRAAGIFPVFSNGNAGPACSTTGAPDYENVMAVGATNNMDIIAGFSSRGPALITEITKPDVAAPGVSVYSAYNNSGYGLMSGTSMAAPHVAGQAALIWAAVPELRGHVQLTYWIIEQTAMPILDGQCGDPNPPNNVYGWGRIDAYEAVSLALSSVWQTSWLTVDPLMGVVPPDETAEILLGFDTHELEDGLCYDTMLRIEFNDPYMVETYLPVELCVSDVADLKVTKIADPSPVFIGEPLTYTITILNKGPSTATGVSIIDTLPAEVTFVSASPGCSHSAGIVTCELEQLDAGAGATVEILVTAPDIIGNITNVVSVASVIYDSDLTNNTASLTTKVKEPPIRKVYLPLVISQ